MLKKGNEWMKNKTVENRFADVSLKINKKKYLKRKKWNYKIWNKNPIIW